jgi:hypothetical protein
MKKFIFGIATLLVASFCGAVVYVNPKEAPYVPLLQKKSWLLLNL